MLIDHEMELTASGGHDLTAMVLDAQLYGAKPLDLKTTSRDVAIGEPLHAFMQLVEGVAGGAALEIDDITSCTFAVFNDDDGAGSNKITLVSRSLLQAACTVAAGVRHIGVIPSGLITKRYLTAGILPTGGSAPENAIKCKIWLEKGTDVARANNASII